MNKQQDIFNKYFPENTPSKVPTTISDSKFPIGTIDNLSGQRAQGNINIDGFSTKIKELLDNAWEDGWGDFTVNGVKKEVIENMPLPLVIFDVINRTPSKGKIGLKPRATEIMIDPENNDYSIILHRKWFDAVVEFLVLDATNQDAMKLAERLELFIETYTGFFKEAGISELIFQEEVDSRFSKNYVEGVPSRCLRYQLVLERIVSERVRTTKEVRSKIQSMALNRG